MPWCPTEGCGAPCFDVRVVVEESPALDLLVELRSRLAFLGVDMGRQRDSL